MFITKNYHADHYFFRRQTFLKCQHGDTNDDGAVVHFSLKS
jgi:hypothetical protein